MVVVCLAIVHIKFAQNYVIFSKKAIGAPNNLHIFFRLCLQTEPKEAPKGLSVVLISTIFVQKHPDLHLKRA